jgi:hypothetical protein
MDERCGKWRDELDPESRTATEMKTSPKSKFWLMVCIRSFGQFKKVRDAPLIPGQQGNIGRLNRPIIVQAPQVSSGQHGRVIPTNRPSEHQPVNPAMASKRS